MRLLYSEKVDISNIGFSPIVKQNAEWLCPYSSAHPGYNAKGQFHVRDLFLGKLNGDDDFAERLLNPRFNSISRA